MSGSVPGGQSAEPNLTPMLDMVFQLITFFVLVLNFKAAELDLSLKLPVLGSARPLPPGANFKMAVLNVNVCTPCPHEGCDAYATMHREYDDTGELKKTFLVCEKGHQTDLPSGVITDGKTCLSVNGQLLRKEPREGHLSIDQYLDMQAKTSMDAQGITDPDDVLHGKKELDETVIIRADKDCRFSAVDYIVDECHKRGYRKFAFKASAVIVK